MKQTSITRWFAVLLALQLVLPAQRAAAQQAETSGDRRGADLLALESDVLAAARRVTASFEGEALEQALSEIGRQAGVQVMFGEDVLRSSRKVSMRLRSETLSEALEHVLRGSGLEAVPAPGGRAVMVKRTSQPAPRAVAVPDTVTGRVVEAGSRNPIVGAEIVVAGRTVGVTGQDGRFTISLPDGTHEVMVNMIGYAPQRKSITLPGAAGFMLLFELQLRPFALNELVVTGVTDPIEGVKLPFTVGKLGEDKVASVPATGSVLAGLQGKVAGVTVQRESGEPGAEPSILLRSPTSIQKSNAPMIVVDGVILASSYVTPSVDISALDIESIEVVKGAAAASLYGSRAAAGVVQIRTRRGSALAQGETRITARSEFGASSLPRSLPLATHHYWRVNENGEFLDAAGNVTTDPTKRVIDPDRMIDNEYGVPLYDNVRTFYRPGRYLNNSITIGQNNGTTNFSISMVDSHDGGTLENNDGFRNRSFRLNLDHRLADDFTLSGSAYHARANRDLVVGSPYWSLLNYAPDVDLGRKGPDGKFLQQPDPTVAVENPIWLQASREDEEQRMRTLANITGRYAPLNWLSFSGMLSYDRTDINTSRYTPKGTPLSLTTDNPSSGSLAKNRVGVDAINASASASMMGTLGDLTARLNLTALIERERNEFVSATGTDFYVPDVPALNVAANRTVSSSLTEIRSTGYLAQTGLDYAGRYIADLLVRRDGSSLFGPDQRWHTYYRGALAYRISEEPWFNVPGVNDLKLRYARGTAGGRPAYTDRFESWGVLSSGEVYRSALGNKNLKPSRTTEQEFGLDLIAANRYSLQLSYVTQKTEDQLISIPVRAVTGYTSQVRNAGAMEGHSYEATLEARVIERPGFSWSTTFTADRSRSRITDWQRSCYVTQLVRYCAGSSMSDIWGQRFLTSPDQLPAQHAGSRDQFQVNDDGYLVPVGAGNSWRDGLARNLWGTTVNIDGTSYAWGIPILKKDEAGLTAVERIGSSAPDVSLGWLNNISWKGFDFFTHMHVQLGGEIYNNTRQRLYSNRRHADVDQSGKADESKKPEPYYYALYNLNAISEPFLEDGTFLKLREVAVKYGLDRNRLERVGLGSLGIERITLGLSGRNLFTLTDYTGFDPEVGSILQRYDSNSYPNTRALTGTVEITF